MAETKYLIVDFDSGSVSYTTDEVKAHEFAEADDVYAVIDLSTLAELDGTAVPEIE